MQTALIESITSLTPDDGASLRRWLDKHPATELEWVEPLHLTHLKAIESNSIQDIKELRVHLNGSLVISGVLLSALGSKQDLKAAKGEIQAALRAYLGWLGLKRASLVLVNTISKQPEVFADPQEIHVHFRLALDLLDGLHDELHRIAKKRAKMLTQDEHIGALVLSLCIRDGALSTPEIKRALIEIEEGRLIRFRNLWYVAGPVSADGTHFRRLYLSPLTVALALARPNRKKAKPSEMLSESVKAIGARLGIQARKGLSLKSVIIASAHHLRSQDAVPQHLIDYMQLKLRSDSLAESCWARLLGMKPNPDSLLHEQALLASRRRSEYAKPSEYRRPDSIKRLMDAGAGEAPSMKAKAVLACIDQMRAEGIAPAHAILVDWVEWMLKINQVEVSTAKGHLANICRPLLSSMDSPDQRFDDPEQWESLVEEMLREEMSHSKLINAVHKMSEFLSFRHGGDFAHKGFSNEAIVNAWVLTEREKDTAIQFLQRDYEGADPELAKQATYLIELAYYLGCRKWEILGLTYEEVVGVREPLLKLHDNAIRRVKTNCSTRSIPLGLAKHGRFYESWRRQCQMPEASLPTDSILKTIGFDLEAKEAKLIRAINKALKEATHSSEVTVHTLRHSCISRLMLALELPHLDLGELDTLPYFQEIADCTEAVRGLLIRPSTESFLEHKTVSAVAGHLSFATTAGHYFHFYDVLRLGHLRIVNRDSKLPDSIELVAACGRQKASGDAQIADDVLNILAAANQSSWIEHTVLSEASPAASASGTVLKSKLRQVAELSVIPEEKRDEHLISLIPDAKKRADYLASLNSRLAYVEELLTKKHQFNTRDGGILVMPKDVPAQAEINRLLDRTSTFAPDNKELVRLASAFHKLMKALVPREPGVYEFASAENAHSELAPLIEILGPKPVHIEAWYQCSKRLNGKVVKTREAFQQVSSCLDIAPLDKGKLRIRLRQADANGNRRERVTKWLLSSIFAVYGKARK